MLFARTSTRMHVIIYLSISATSGVMLAVGLLMIWCGVSPTLSHHWETALFVLAQVVVVAILFAPVVMNLATLLWLTRTKAAMPCVVSTVIECASVGALIMHTYSAVSESIDCSGSLCNYDYVFCAGIIISLVCCASNAIVSVILLSKILFQLGGGRLHDRHTLVFSRPAPRPMPPPSPRPLYSGGHVHYFGEDEDIQGGDDADSGNGNDGNGNGHGTCGGDAGDGDGDAYYSVVSGDNGTTQSDNGGE